MKTYEPGRDRDIQGLDWTGHGNRDPIIEQTGHVLGEADRLASQDMNTAMGRIAGK